MLGLLPLPLAGEGRGEGRNLDIGNSIKAPHPPSGTGTSKAFRVMAIRL